MTWTRIDQHTVRTSDAPIRYAVFADPDDATDAIRAMNSKLQGFVIAGPHGEFADLFGTVASPEVWEALAEAREHRLPDVAKVYGLPDVAVTNPEGREPVIVELEPATPFTSLSFESEHYAARVAGQALAAVATFRHRYVTAAAKDDVIEEWVRGLAATNLSEDAILGMLRSQR